MGKKDGVVYTPVDVVEKMLDMAGYFPDRKPGFLETDFLDNSCGNGNILVVALERACDALDKITDALAFTPEQKYSYYKYGLTNHFHGMEINETECGKCMERMNEVVSAHLGTNVKWDWDIRCCDSLNSLDLRTFDYIVCNPPYIRTRDIDTDLTGYEFVKDGMKDIYLAFYELGLRQLKPTGTMCYITPSSWFTSAAGKTMRDVLYKTRMISQIYDYGHRQVFDDATTYVEITVLDFHAKKLYVEYGSEESGDKRMMIPYDWVMVDGKFYFTDPETKKILNSVQKAKGNIRVKNGFATLADDVFIPKDMQEAHRVYHSVRPWNIIPVIKSSTGKQEWCYYPYDKNGKLMEEKCVDEIILETLRKSKDKLESRATTEPWYAFGRTQAINDTYKDKWAIKSIVKTVDDIKPVFAPAGTGVYGGLYILCDGPEQLECLKTEEFLDYVKSLKKYKSGGYYTFSSKDLEKYLNWKNYETEKS